MRLGALDQDPGVRPNVHQLVDYAAPWAPVPTTVTRASASACAGSRTRRRGSAPLRAAALSEIAYRGGDGREVFARRGSLTWRGSCSLTSAASGALAATPSATPGSGMPDDVVLLLDHLDIGRAFIGGAGMGSGVAIRAVLAGASPWGSVLISARARGADAVPPDLVELGRRYAGVLPQAHEPRQAVGRPSRTRLPSALGSHHRSRTF